jgi:hypothetical protein
MDKTQIVSGFGNAVTAREFTLVDEHGRTLAILSATQGKPVLAFYDGKGKITACLTLDADDKPLFGYEGSDGHLGKSK